MIATYLIAILIVFGVLVSWVGVQHLARNFAARHPEFGALREARQGCGMLCGCAERESCPRRNKKNSDGIEHTDVPVVESLHEV